MNVVPTPDKKLAHSLSTEIREGAQMIEKAWVLMGQKLYEFEQIEGWTQDGSDSQNFREWCGAPECPMSYSHARALIQIYRTYCVNFALPVEQVAAGKVRGLLAARKAVEEGRTEPAQAVADAESLSESDMKALYDGNRRNADGGPALARCPTCRHLVPEKDIERAAA